MSTSILNAQAPSLSTGPVCFQRGLLLRGGMAAFCFVYHLEGFAGIDV
jgi:hypothetical protein